MWLSRRPKPPCYCHEDGHDPLSNDGLCHICRGVPQRRPYPAEIPKEIEDRIVKVAMDYADRTYSQRIAERDMQISDLKLKLKLETANAVIAALKDVVRNQ